ncbi:MAG: bifunctional DNA primase/polymerase [Pseudomonadales bacterium]|nr:bifunctional DNA primase/polymerase [Pseudomonadales bacterium]
MHAVSFIKLINAGFSLVPIPYGTKSPKATQWNLRDNCVSEQEDLDKLVGKNVGLAHAYCGPSPTCAIDLDDYEKATAWLLYHGIDLGELENASDAVMIRSGKANSLKLIYRLPEGTGALASKQVLDQDDCMILEFRCAARNGLTVQDLIPPSIHPSGTTYQWMGSGAPSNPPTIPAHLLEVWLQLLLRDRREGVTTSQLMGRCSEAETPRRVARIRDALEYIDASCDYYTWRDVVWGVLSTGWTCAVDLAEEWSRSAPDRYENNAFWVLVSSYNPQIDGGHSLGTVIHHARAGGWGG